MYLSTQVDVLRPHFHPVPCCNVHRSTRACTVLRVFLAQVPRYPLPAVSVLGRPLLHARTCLLPGLPAQLNCNPIQSQAHHHFPSLPWLAHGIFFLPFPLPRSTIPVLPQALHRHPQTIFDSLLSFIPCLDSHDQAFEVLNFPPTKRTSLAKRPSIILQSHLPPPTRPAFEPPIRNLRCPVLRERIRFGIRGFDRRGEQRKADYQWWHFRTQRRQTRRHPGP